MAAGGSFNMGMAAQAPVSGPAMGSQIAAVPAAPTLGQTPAGVLAATTYFVKLTWNYASGESLPGAEANFAASLNNVLTVTPVGTPTVGANGVQAVTGYSVYVSNTAGGGSGAETKQANNIPLGTTWTEPTSGLVGGATPPTISANSSPGAVQPMGQPIAAVPLSGANGIGKTSGSSGDGHSGF
jgi:hypothetical protein